MANTYRMNIMGLDVQPYNLGHPNIVSAIHWQYSASNDSGAYGATNGICAVKFNPDSEIYVPFEDITEEIAMTWLLSGLGEPFLLYLPVAMDQLLAQNQNLIDTQTNFNRTSCMTPPWSPNSVTPNTP